MMHYIGGWKLQKGKLLIQVIINHSISTSVGIAKAQII